MELDHTKLKVHPAADIFPMMSDEELQSLADDIKQNGLVHSIIVSNDCTTLIDGRNRLKACLMAGERPIFDKLNGEDPIAFIASANLQRRSLSKGQQAMAMAMLYPEPDKRGRGNKGKSSETADFSATRLKQARAVLRFSPELAQAVLSGAKKFDQAYDEAISAIEILQKEEDELSILRREAPDLAGQVEEDTLTLSEAYAAFKARIAEKERLEHSKRETLLRVTESAYHNIIGWASDDFVKEISERLPDEEFKKAFTERLRLSAEDIPRIEEGARMLSQVLAVFVGGKK